MVVIEKESNTGLIYSAVQMILHSSDKLHHPPEDDDRSAVTFWLPKSNHRREELAQTFERMAAEVRNAPSETGLDERSAFDAWAVKHGRVIGYNGWRNDFEVWQARACLDKVKEMNR